jgi:hypothetical protein
MDQGSMLNSTKGFDPQRVQASDEQSLIKARYCRSILKVTAISTEQEARSLLEGLTTEQPTANTSTAMAEAEQSALDAIRELAGRQHGRSALQISNEWLRAVRAIESWLSLGG